MLYGNSFPEDEDWICDKCQGVFRDLYTAKEHKNKIYCYGCYEDILWEEEHKEEWKEEERLKKQIEEKKKQSRNIEIMNDIINNNCLSCKHFRKDINISPCICEIIMDIMLYEGIDFNDTGFLFQKIREEYVK